MQIERINRENDDSLKWQLESELVQTDIEGRTTHSDLLQLDGIMPPTGSELSMTEPTAAGR